MEGYEIENGIIESTMLGIEDHGVMSAWLYLKFNGTGQGFGGYVLDTVGDKEKFTRAPSIACGGFVAEVLKTVGVEKWEDVKGKHLRVRRKESLGKIDAIGNIIKDIWFCPEEYFKEMKNNGRV